MLRLKPASATVRMVTEVPLVLILMYLLLSTIVLRLLTKQELDQHLCITASMSATVSGVTLVKCAKYMDVAHPTATIMAFAPTTQLNASAMLDGRVSNVAESCALWIQSNKNVLDHHVVPATMEPAPASTVGQEVIVSFTGVDQPKTVPNMAVAMQKLMSVLAPQVGKEFFVRHKNVLQVKLAQALNNVPLAALATTAHACATVCLRMTAGWAMPVKFVLAQAERQKVLIAPVMDHAIQMLRLPNFLVNVSLVSTATTATSPAHRIAPDMENVVTEVNAVAMLAGLVCRVIVRA
jgi:hypothetical protein